MCVVQSTASMKIVNCTRCTVPREHRRRECLNIETMRVAREDIQKVGHETAVCFYPVYVQGVFVKHPMLKSAL